MLNTLASSAVPRSGPFRTLNLGVWLLLDSRAVELTKARHPIFVILSSSKSFFFQSLKVEWRALDQIAA